MSIIVVKEQNKKYFTAIKFFVYISIIIVLKIKYQYLIKF